MRELIIRSRDLEKLSVQKLEEYKSKHETQGSFDMYDRYIPSKEYIRNKKAFVMEEERLRDRNGEMTAKLKTKVTVSKLMKSLEKEIFKDKN